MKIRTKRVLSHIVSLPFFISCATVGGMFFRYVGFPETNIVLLYLLAVLFTCCLTPGYIYGICASVAATLAYNVKSEIDEGTEFVVTLRSDRTM